MLERPKTSQNRKRGKIENQNNKIPSYYYMEDKEGKIEHFKHLPEDKYVIKTTINRPATSYTNSR